MFKTIVFKQPWAHMLCSGIINAIPCQLLEQGKHARIYIVAGEMDYQFIKKPIEWQQEAMNAATFGIIPPFHALPTNRLIGFGQPIFEVMPHSASIWSSHTPCWQFQAAHLFDQPLPTNIRPDLLIDEPFHEIDHLAALPSVKNGTLTIHVNPAIFEHLANGGVLSFDLSNQLSWLLLNDNYAICHFHHIIIRCGIKQRTFSSASGGALFPRTGLHGKARLFTSVRTDHKIAALIISFNLIP